MKANYVRNSYANNGMFRAHETYTKAADAIAYNTSDEQVFVFRGEISTYSNDTDNARHYAHVYSFSCGGATFTHIHQIRWGYGSVITST